MPIREAKSVGPQRIYILGAPASGKSTLARRLSQEHGLPQVELDGFFWDDASTHYNVRRDPAERDRLLTAAASAESWIMEGVYWGWCAPAFERADRIILLDVPLWLRHWRLARRHLRRRLGIEASLEKDTLRGTLITARWNHRWNRDNLPRAMQKLEAYRSKLQVFQNPQSITLF
jgi:adenylate kinase family enzyme